MEWDRIWELFEASLERPEEERASWLSEACGGDASLRRRVEELLAAHHRVDGLMDPSMPREASREGLPSTSPKPAMARVGRYEVLEEIGRGGMGVVYRALDARLGRKVALKVLPEVFAKNVDRMRRFEREAQALASLNHPNIASIYGLEEVGEIRAIAMELVEGPTLSAYLFRNRISFEEALPLARQIADGLEAAHERGIVHRDLKPSNIKVTPDLGIKILDFGLAKALDQENSSDDTMQSPSAMTQSATPSGVVLGTAAYMSPEQARGRTVDKRTDIWSFGVVLYEMLTGRQPFRGESVSDTLAAILMSEPDWPALSGVPPAVRWLLRRCLEKDARRRLRDIGEARVALAGDLAVTPEGPWVMRRGFWDRRRILPVLAGAALGALATGGGVAIWRRGARTEPPPLRKLELPVAGDFRDPMISPDGTRVAYVGDNKVRIHDLPQFAPRDVSGSEGARGVFWSPDSRHVAYGAGDRLWRAPAGGGGATTICVVPGGFYDGAGGAWLPDGQILFDTGGSGLFSVSADGGDPAPALEPKKDEIDFHETSPLPGGGALFVVHRQTAADTLAVFAGGRRKDILTLNGQTLSNPVYAGTGHILYHRGSGNPGVWALPFSMDGLGKTGDPFLVLANARWPSVSSESTLTLVRGGGRNVSAPVWLNSDGKVERTLGGVHPYYRFFGLSPDGKRLAVPIAEAGGSDIWIYELDRGSRIRLAATPEPESFPSWSPDGKRLVFRRGSEIIVRDIQTAREVRTGISGLYPHFTPDGNFLVYAAPGVNPAYFDLFRLALENGKPEVVIHSSARKSSPRVSPDGRYLAYMSEESGDYQVYLSRFPSGEGKWQVSLAGGRWPAWSRTGDRLYFTDPQRALMQAEIGAGAQLQISAPRKLFDRGPHAPDYFSVSPDGRGFIALQNAPAQRSASGITLIQNWFAEFRK